MSTPDDLVLPAEAVLAQRQVPRAQSPLEAPAHYVPTPGVSPAVLKHPGMPTLPEADPVSLTLVVQRLANELYAGGQLPAPSGGGAPASPFGGPLDFTAFRGAQFPAFSLPLLSDAVVPPAVPTAISPPAAAAPSAIAAPSWPGAQLDPAVVVVDRTPRLFDAHALKREFPILQERVNGRELVWLDNAATTQKPRAVIDRLSRFYEKENSNIHRAAHTLAARSTDAYEGARESARRFINAPETREIVFVRGTTEGLNLIAQSWGRRHVKEGDEILITWLEHHANIVPWQQLAAEKGAKLRVAPVDDRGQIILEEYEKLLSPRTRLVSFTQVSNALGTVTPAKEMTELAHRHGALVVVDGAQSVSHLPTDVQALGCDFFVFSGHKVFAPTGIGVVWGRAELLDAMPPWQGGGNMIKDVTFERTQFHAAPARFEAGTGSIGDAAALGAALDWLARLGVSTVAAYEHELLDYATACLSDVPGLTLYGTAPEKAGVLSFVLEGQETTQIGSMLDKEGIAVRSGHHCAQPILRRFGLEATVRASLAPYNTRDDIDALVAALRRIQEGRR
ncbi:MAG: family 2A encapsulin nanocompartment cargo protein cysteine desulfurase [Myxococcota bacterium]